MPQRTPSQTALGVAALRAAHLLVDDAPPILNDSVALALLPAPAREHLLRRPADLQHGAARGLRSHVVTRSRFAEDRLQAAVEVRDIHQYVLLGAGYDTFAYRQPSWAGALRIFEVDQPSTQQAKRERLREAGISEPANVTYVPVDFEAQSLADALALHHFETASPACVSWLGVTMYLDEAANDAVFRYVASLARGSELVFTFASAPDADDPVRAGMAARVAELGEPWRTFYEPRALSAHLTALGFETVWMPSPAEIAARYFLGRHDDLPLPRRRTLASAIV